MKSLEKSLSRASSLQLLYKFLFYLLMVRNKWLTLIMTLYQSGLVSHSHSVHSSPSLLTMNSARFRISLQMQESIKSSDSNWSEKLLDFIAFNLIQKRKGTDSEIRISIKLVKTTCQLLMV